MDRFSAKHVFSAFFTITGIGLLLFGFSSNLYILIFARFITGFGGSVALMAAFKVNAEVFPKNLATVNGITMFMGGVGGFIAGKPLQFFFSHGGWHLCNIVLGILVLATVLLTLVLDTRISPPVNENNKSFLMQLSEMKMILAKRDFILLCFLAVVPFGVLIAMFTFWTSEWLVHVNSFSISAVAICISLMAIADFVGPLFWGVAADFFNKKGIRFEATIFCGIVICFGVQLLILLNITNTLGNYILWFCFIFFMQAGSLAFACSVSIFKSEYIGRAVTTLEILMFAAAFIIQLSFGYIVKMFNYLGVPMQYSYSYTFEFFLIVELLFCLLFIIITALISKKNFTFAWTVLV
ncbi:MAG: MFS transporter [bacterium]